MLSRISILCVALQSLHISHAGTMKGSGFKDPAPIKYPGPVKDISNRYGNTTDEGTVPLPKECEGKSFCTIKPPDYPQEKFNGMFKGKKQISQAAWVPEDEFDNRQGDPSETDGCDTKVSYEPLYQVRNRRDGDWRTVIQAPEENFVQRVRLEECKQPKAK